MGKNLKEIAFSLVRWDEELVEEHRMRTLPLLCTFCSCIAAATLQAGSATWTLDPVNGDWNTAVNWTPETVPNDSADIATFASSNTTNVSLSQQTDVDSIVFDPSANAYTINTAAHRLTFFGAGIVNNSLNQENFVTGIQDGDLIAFRNNSTAGNALVTVHGDALQPFVFFHDNSTAGTATFINNGGFGGAVTWFFNSSSADSATFYNYSLGDGFNDGVTVFMNHATAATATIFCQGGGAVFHDYSTAANSTLIADSGNIVFADNASAGDAMVVANGAPNREQLPPAIFFISGQARAGNATLVANGGRDGGTGGLIVCWYQTRGDKARVQLSGNGRLIIKDHDPLAPMTIGSLEGDGAVTLGANNLAVGRNHLQTIFSGVINDGIGFTGGSITKVGVGTLDLRGSSSYTGGTLIESGNLLVDNTLGSATGTGPVQVNGGTLGGKGIIAGPVSIGTGQVNRGILSPGIKGIGLLTIQNSVTFAGLGSYNWKMDTVAVMADEITAAGVTIDNGALFSAVVKGNSVLPIGTTFSVINNTGPQAISGRFSNLPDGSSFTAGNNTFQASYSGGDGNDLTLTVVP